MTKPKVSAYTRARTDTPLAPPDNLREEHEQHQLFTDKKCRQDAQACAAQWNEFQALMNFKWVAQREG